MGELPDFERGHIIGGRLTGASLKKKVVLFGVSTATFSKVTSGCMNHGKSISARRNSGRKSTLTERDVLH
jgi:hypothetical protein